MNSAPSNANESVSKIETTAQCLATKAISEQTASGSTSFNREVRAQDEPQKEPLKLSLKRKPGEDRSVTQALSEIRCKVTTSENQVSGRQSPQPSGQPSQPFAFYPLAGFYGQNSQTYDQQLQQSSEAATPIKERVFICPLEGCGKKYSTSASLIRHKRIHKGGRLYQCRSCDYTSQDSSHISRHFKSKHPKQSQDGKKWVRVPKPDSTSTPPHTISTARLWNRPHL